MLALVFSTIGVLIATNREGLRDINELKEVYKEKIEHHKKKAAVQLPTPPTTPTSDSVSSNSPFPPPPPSPSIPVVAKPNPGIKTLSSYLDVPKTLALPPKEIETIWRLRHASNAQSLCATIPLPVYEQIALNAKKHPHFILPLPKENEGAEIHFLQWTFPAPDTVTVLFTHLAEYKLRGEYAQAHTTLTHHLELAEEKGVVLMKGEVMEGRGVSVDEAKWLVMCLQKFYGVGAEKEERRKLLEQFTGGDETFNLDVLIDEAEKVV